MLIPPLRNCQIMGLWVRLPVGKAPIKVNEKIICSLCHKAATDLAVSDLEPQLHLFHFFSILPHTPLPPYILNSTSSLLQKSFPTFLTAFLSVSLVEKNKNKLKNKPSGAHGSCSEKKKKKKKKKERKKKKILIIHDYFCVGCFSPFLTHVKKQSTPPPHPPPSQCIALAGQKSI